MTALAACDEKSREWPDALRPKPAEIASDSAGAPVRTRTDGATTPRPISRNDALQETMQGVFSLDFPGFLAEPVFLPGLFETPHVWQDIKKRLGRPDAMCLDLPGHLATSPATGRGAGVEDGPAIDDWIDETAARIRTAHNGAAVVLVGHSTGGLLALALAARHPDLVAGLVVVGALTAGDRGRRFDICASAMKIPGIGLPLGRALWAAWLSSPETFRRGIVSAAGLNLDTPWAEDMRKALSGCDPDAIGAFTDWVLTADIEHLLEKVDAPILSLIGTRDRVVTPQHQLRLLRKAPNAQAMLLDGGHLLFAEHPEPVVVAIEAWLRRCAANTLALPA